MTSFGDFLLSHIHKFSNRHITSWICVNLFMLTKKNSWIWYSSKKKKLVEYGILFSYTKWKWQLIVGFSEYVSFLFVVVPRSACLQLGFQLINIQTRCLYSCSINFWVQYSSLFYFNDWNVVVLGCLRELGKGSPLIYFIGLMFFLEAWTYCHTSITS